MSQSREPEEIVNKSDGSIRDLSCKYITCDDYFHFTRCVRKMDYLSALEDAIEEHGLEQYYPLMSLVDVRCSKCDGCGYEASLKGSVRLSDDEPSTFCGKISKEELLKVVEELKLPWAKNRLLELEKQISSMKQVLA